MTYQEALTLKSKFGEYLQIDNKLYSVLIVPSNIDNLVSFFADYDKHTYTDSTCKQYSKEKSETEKYRLQASIDKIDKKLNELDL